MYSLGKTASKDPYNFSMGSSAPTTSKPTATKSSTPSKQPAPAKPAKSEKSKILPSDFQPKRFGIRFDPPTIVLEYLTQNTGKLYHHKMKMVKLQPETPTPHAIEYLKKKHYQFFMGGKISDNQLQGLIDKMKARLKALKGHSKQRPETASTMAGSTSKVTTPTPATKQSAVPAKQSKQMSKEFDDYGMEDEDGMFDYAWNNKGKQPAKGLPQPPAKAVQPSKVVQPAKVISAPAPKGRGKAISKFQVVQYDEAYEDENEEEEEEYGEDYEEDEGYYDEEGEEIDEEEYRRIYEQMNYNQLNMNKLSNEELAQHKAIMDSVYKKNIKRPGDPGYQYDLQADFRPSQDNDWDMDDDDEADII